MRIVSLSRMRSFQKQLNEYSSIYEESLLPIFDYLSLKNRAGFLKGKKRMRLFITSDRGLNGSYSNMIVKELDTKDYNCLIGKKAIRYARVFSLTSLASWNDLDYSHLSETVGKLRDEIYALLKKYGDDLFSFEILYVHHHSFAHHGLREIEVFKTGEEPRELVQELYPSSGEAVDAMLQQQLYYTLYYTCLHALTSEYSMRANSMENACENAEDLKKAYQLEINKRRQEQITQEIIEISSNLK
jgi:F-type H+-transporting ATPase subunit gamma